MTLKARVAKLCEELGVEPPSGGGLAPTVRLCAAAAEVPYETIGKTVEALELEVFGVAAVAPAAATTPADKKKRKRAVKRETAAGSDDDEPLEAKTFTAEELAQQRYDKAKADGDVVELSDDDGEAKGAIRVRRLVKKRPASIPFEIPPILRRNSDDSF